MLTTELWNDPLWAALERIIKAIDLRRTIAIDLAGDNPAIRENINRLAKEHGLTKHDILEIFDECDKGKILRRNLIVQHPVAEGPLSMIVWTIGSTTSGRDPIKAEERARLVSYLQAWQAKVPVAPCNHSSIALEYRQIADQLTKAAERAAKANHLAKHIGDYSVSAGRLLVQAIDGGLFPKERKQQNRAWWDRRIARFPGGVIALYGSIPQWAFAGGELTTGDTTIKLLHDAVPDAESRIRADAVKPFEPAQFARCWTFAVGSWLAKKFPERFRHKAESWDWWHAATDEYGRPLGKNGKPLKGRWYRNGEMMPSGFVPRMMRPTGKPPISEAEQVELLNQLTDEDMRKLHEPDPSAEHYEWKLDGPIAGTTDFYDDADRLEHQRIRADVHASACRLLAELIAPANKHGDGEPSQCRADDLPMLSPKASAVYELLLELPEHRGMTGPQIINALPIEASMDESTLRKSIVPALEPYGLEHVPKIGYRIKPSKRPPAKLSD